MTRSTKPSRFLDPDEAKAVAAAIESAERASSAELKVAIGTRCNADIRLMAADLFRKYGLERTEQRNCALVLLLTENREFLIYGDEGIHDKVGQAFWSDVRDVMAAEFKEGRFGDGLAKGVTLIGEKLAQFFPYQDGDKDEISNEIVYEG